MSETVHSLLDHSQSESLSIAEDFSLNKNVTAEFSTETKIISVNRSETSV